MNQQSPKPNYLIYPSLLDKFDTYRHIEQEYERPWYKDLTPAEIEDKIERELLDSINRVPFESEPAEKGSAFDEMIAKMNAGELVITSEMVDTPRSGPKEMTIYEHQARSGNAYTFQFPTYIVKDFVHYFKGSTSQIYCEGVIETKYGLVKLYGYADRIREDICFDIKTTSQYEFQKYKGGWQQHTYPFCLRQMGCEINEFEYTVTDFRSTYQESYMFNYEKSAAKLREICEHFIEFVEARRDRITDLKIFNQHEDDK